MSLSEAFATRFEFGSLHPDIVYFLCDSTSPFLPDDFFELTPIRRVNWLLNHENQTMLVQQFTAHPTSAYRFLFAAVENEDQAYLSLITSAFGQRHFINPDDPRSDVEHLAAFTARIALRAQTTEARCEELKTTRRALLHALNKNNPHLQRLLKAGIKINDIVIPHDFICPLTRTIFVDPIVDENEHHIELEAYNIFRASGRDKTCPVEPHQFRNDFYPVDDVLKERIEQWVNGIIAQHRFFDLHRKAVKLLRKEAKSNKSDTVRKFCNETADNLDQLIHSRDITYPIKLQALVGAVQHSIAELSRTSSSAAQSVITSLTDVLPKELQTVLTYQRLTGATTPRLQRRRSRRHSEPSLPSSSTTSPVDVPARQPSHCSTSELRAASFFVTPDESEQSETHHNDDDDVAERDIRRVQSSRGATDARPPRQFVATPTSAPRRSRRSQLAQEAFTRPKGMSW